MAIKIRSRPVPGKPPTPAPQPPPITPGYTIGSYGNASIDKWDKTIIAASDAVFKKRGVRVDPRYLKSIMGVESGQDGTYSPTKCRPCDGTDCVPACGPFQIKWPYHEQRCKECNSKTVAGQAEMAAHILGMTMLAHDLDEIGAFLKTYFPTDDINGTTQREYAAKIRADVAAMAKDAGEKPPVVTPPAEKPRDIIDIIVGGRPTDTNYGWLAPAAGPYYDYFDEHSAGGPNEDSSHHTGIDATTTKGQTLYTPIAGKVVCAGTDRGPGAWGTGCAAFRDTMGNGAGRIEILTPDEKFSLVLGHCSDALVDVGDVLDIEDPIARAGGDHGWHVHAEVREFVGGAKVYVLRNPRILNKPGALPPQGLPELPPFTFLDSPNKMSRNGIVPISLVYHVSDDLNLDNVLGWLTKRGSDASSHWVIDRDGKAYQLVGSAFAAFTNGKVSNPRLDIPWIAQRANDFIAGRQNANWYTITIEHVGKPDMTFTDEQYATSIAISRYYLAAYPGIPRVRGHMNRHADFDAVDRPYCPGPNFDLRRVILACGGDPDRLSA